MTTYAPVELVAILLSWACTFACACRVHAMDPKTHDLSVIRWHAWTGIVCLLIGGLVVAGRGDPHAALASLTTITAYLMLTLPEWVAGKTPEWAQRRHTA